VDRHSTKLFGEVNRIDLPRLDVDKIGGFCNLRDILPDTGAIVQDSLRNQVPTLNFQESALYWERQSEMSPETSVSRLSFAIVGFTP
jgi:hypothetical protein